VGIIRDAFVRKKEARRRKTLENKGRKILPSFT
jgi:hypothetical protein